MDKNQRLQLLGLRPKRMKLRSGKIISIHAAADGEAAHPKILHALFHLLDSERRMLQGHAAKASETFLMRGAEFRNFLVLNLDDLARKIQIRPIPKRIDRNGLHVNSHFIQIRETLFNVIVYVGRIVRVRQCHIARAALATDAILDEIPGFRHSHVGVNVNNLHSLAADNDFTRFAVGKRLFGGLPWVPRVTK
jgi:hypothetical protein